MDGVPCKKKKPNDWNYQFRDEFKDIALYYEVKAGNEEMVSYLIENGANVNFKNEEGLPLLNIALNERNLVIMKLLLTHKAEANLILPEQLNLLHFAASKNDVEVGKILIEHGYDLNSLTTDGTTALHIAVAKQSVEFVKLLLESGIDVNIKNSRGQTALFKVNCNNCSSALNVIKLLIQHGIDVNSKGLDGNCALHSIINMGTHQVVHGLLEFTCDINVRNTNGDSPFLRAINLYDEKIAMILISAGCNVHLKNNKGESPLYIAIQNNMTNVVERMLQIPGIEISEKIPRCNYKTPMHLAVALKRQKIIRLLLKNKADRDAQDENGETPLHTAVYFCNFAGVKLLVNEGCRIDERTNSNETPLHFTVNKLSSQGVKLKRIVYFLLQSGCDVHARNNDGETPLHKAASFGKDNLVKIFYIHGANIHTRCNKYLSPLHTAFLAGHKKVLTLLLSATYKPDIEECLLLLKLAALKKDTWTVNTMLSQPFILRNITIDDRKKLVDALVFENFQTPITMHHAAREGLFEVVKLFVKYGLDVNVKNRYGQTPLEQAITSGSEEIVEYLIQRGSIINFVNKKGLNALHCAVMKENYAITQVLLKYWADINAKSKNGNTAMHYAAKNNKFDDIIQLLFINGSDLHLKNDYGSTPLSVAITEDSRCKVTLLKYEAILNGNGKFNEDNMHMIRNCTSTSKLYERCNMEIDVAKSSIVSGKLRMWDIIGKSIDYLALYMKNASVREFCDSKKNFFKFPLYANVISYKFNKAIERRDAIETVYDNFCTVLQLPHTVVRKIISYLNLLDLQHLSKVCG